MPAISVLGAMSTGHPGSPPTNPVEWPPTMAIAASPDVLVGGVGVLTVGSAFLPHKSVETQEIHPRVVSTGIPNVLVNGKPVATIGSLLSCSPLDTVATGVPNVIVGG